MIIDARDRDGKRVGITVDTDPASFPGGPLQSGNAIVVEIENDDGDVTHFELDTNHCEALETALRAARLEVQARVLAP